MSPGTWWFTYGTVPVLLGWALVLGLGPVPPVVGMCPGIELHQGAYDLLRGVSSAALGMFVVWESCSNRDPRVHVRYCSKLSRKAGLWPPPRLPRVSSQDAETCGVVLTHPVCYQCIFLS